MQIYIIYIFSLRTNNRVNMSKFWQNDSSVYEQFKGVSSSQTGTQREYGKSIRISQSMYYRPCLQAEYISEQTVT